MTKPTVYVETSVISYLVGRPSSNVIIAGHQVITQIWWRDYRRRSDLFISKAVWDEIGQGDPRFVKRRQKAVQGVPWLQVRQRGIALADSLVSNGLVPTKAKADALHIGVAADHAIQFVVTWNFTHIANVSSAKAINILCTELGMEPPVICSPEQLIAFLPYVE